MSILAVAGDPISAILLRDWAQVGGWSLFISLCMLIVGGAFREWWVPGGRYKRLESSAEKLSEANDELTKQNGQLITANEITKHFFEETVPRRRDMRHAFEDTVPTNRKGGQGGGTTQEERQSGP